MLSDVGTQRARIDGLSEKAGSFLPGVDVKRLCADLAVLSTCAAVLGLFAISPVLLEHFEIAYLTAGGSIFTKFHPSTFALIAALLLRCLAARKPLRTAWTIASGDVNIVLLAISVAIAAAFAVLASQTPVTPLIDTFLVPPLFFVMLRDLHPIILNRLAVLLALVFCVNAALGIFEFLDGSHLVTLPVLEGVSSDPTRGDAVFDWRAELMQDWRATALFGHPLVNGLVVGAFILCLLAPGSRWLSPAFKGPLLILQIASMFAFGARLSLVLTLLFGAYLAFGSCRETLRKNGPLTPRAIGIGLIGIVLLVGIGVGLYETGFFDRTLERFSSDAGSARARTLMFQLFQPLSWSELILGPSQEVVSTWQRLHGLEFGIESSWVGLALTYGLVVTAFIVAGLAVFSLSIVRASGRGAAILLVSFFITVSGSTGLSGKTTSLAMMVVLALLYLRKDERRLSLRSALSA